MISTKYIPLRSLTTNTSGISGHYCSTITAGNLNYLKTTLTDFPTRLPARLVGPLLPRTALLVSSQVEYEALTAQIGLSAAGVYRPGMPKLVDVNTGGLNQLWIDSALGQASLHTLLHEWGHRVDFQWRHAEAGDATSSTYFGAKGARSGMADFEALWKHIITLKAAYPAVTPYAWTNQVECFAELFAHYWYGNGTGAMTGDKAAFDPLIREITTGQSAVSDSWTTYAMDLMVNLTPPALPAKYL